MFASLFCGVFLFLSTLSLRRATQKHKKSPCKALISIHALLAESDVTLELYNSLCQDFYPRSPCGERPLLSSYIIVYVKISIHALLAESDRFQNELFDILWRFLSTLSLRRATVVKMSIKFFNTDFYPRSPCGERPRTGLTCGGGRNISIHALLAESDQLQGFLLAQGHNFYPRSPCGERLCVIELIQRGFVFLSTLSLRRATTQF